MCSLAMFAFIVFLVKSQSYISSLESDHERVDAVPIIVYQKKSIFDERFIDWVNCVEGTAGSEDVVKDRLTFGSR